MFKDSEDFKNMLVKEIYEENPPIRYPMITIEEIDNSENTEFTDNIGEHISNLGYQINCYSKNTKTMQAPEAARTIGFKYGLSKGLYFIEELSSNIIKSFNLLKLVA